MNHDLIALGVLAIHPLTLQAKPLAGSPVSSGIIRFTGSVTTPTCTVMYQHKQLVSHCFSNIAENQNGYIVRPLNNVLSELVSNVTSEKIHNKSNLERVTISYK
ncbi:hypothetical protein [Serratia symbiotica]|uniref:hypothetical protein n=1 Tax=Serratia symbiotica TaxID=138074 RepID=UPI003464A663